MARLIARSVSGAALRSYAFVGEPGRDGVNGAGFTAAEIDGSGDLIVTYQPAYAQGETPTASSVNLGHVVGADGAKGDKGDKGDPGATGAQGAKGDKGDPGDDYILTAQDKSDIADLVLAALPTAQGVLYGD